MTPFIVIAVALFLILIPAGLFLYKFHRRKKRRSKYYRRRAKNITRALVWTQFMGRKPLLLEWHGKEKHN